MGWVIYKSQKKEREREGGGGRETERIKKREQALKNHFLAIQFEVHCSCYISCNCIHCDLAPL